MGVLCLIFSSWFYIKFLIIYIRQKDGVIGVGDKSP